jgi:type IV pilus assembly protein PilF
MMNQRHTLPKIWALFGLTIAFLFSGCAETTRGNLGGNDPEAARDAYIQLGVEYLRLDDRENAKQRFLRALEIDDDSSGAYTGLAVIYQRSGENAEAERYFRRALRADDDFTQAKIQYGLFLIDQARYDDACDVLDEARQDTLARQRHLALLYLGRCQYLNEQYQDAIETLDLATRVNSRFFTPYLELARVYVASNQMVEAKRAITTYLDRGQETAEALLLGINIERTFRNTQGEMALAAKLRAQFPYSQEWLDYQEMIAND